MPNKKISQIANLPFLEIGYACEITFALKVVSLAHNRVIWGRYIAFPLVPKLQFRNALAAPPMFDEGHNSCIILGKWK